MTATSFTFVPLTNPFSDPTLHSEAQSRGPLSRFISRKDIEDRVIAAVSRVITIRITFFKSMQSLCYEVLGDVEKCPCSLDSEVLSYPVDMLIVAAKFMDVFNQCLASRMPADSVMHNGSPYSMSSILDDDFSEDLFPLPGAAPSLRLSPVCNIGTFLEEEKIVRELLEFGRE